tara:strand:+ start:299 stop:592 length:294 start_codon:yes stop_codon:yes gene_type:complete
MKNYGDVKFPKGTVGFESENGYNNWWYPGKSTPIELPMKVTARHLHLWRNQDPYMVFAIPMCIFDPPMIFEKEGRKQYVAVWFHKEDIDEIINSKTL